MKKTMIALSALALAAAGCQKDNSTKKKQCTTGDMKFTNNSSNPYNIYVDGAQATTVAGKSTATYSVKVGTHEYKAEQASGYVLYPSVYTTSGYMSECGTNTFAFPK